MKSSVIRVVMAAVLILLLGSGSALATGPGFGADYQVPINNGYNSYQSGNFGDGAINGTWQTWYSILPTDPGDPNGPQTVWWYYAYQFGNAGFAPHIGSFLMNMPDAVAQATQFEGDSYTMMPDPRSDGSVRPVDWFSRFWNEYNSGPLGDGSTTMGWAADPNYHMLPLEGSSANPYFEWRSLYSPVPVTFNFKHNDYTEISNPAIDPPFTISGPGGPQGPPVPEPGTLLLLGAGLAGIGLMRWRSRKQG
jgi:hypothetical protein